MSQSHRRLLLREEIYEHYRIYLGEESARENYKEPTTGEILSIQHFFAQDAYELTISNGCSQLYFGDPNKHFEALFISKQGFSTNPQAAHLILMSFAQLLEQATQFNIGDYTEARELLSPLSVMSHLMFLPPIHFPVPFHELSSQAVHHSILFLWLLPLHFEEVRYAQEHGPRHLLMLFTACDSDLSDLSRPPAQTSITPKQAQKITQEKAIALQKRLIQGYDHPSSSSVSTEYIDHTHVKIHRLQNQTDNPESTLVSDHKQQGDNTMSIKQKPGQSGPIKFDLNQGKKGNTPQKKIAKTSKTSAKMTTRSKPAPSKKKSHEERVAELKALAQQARKNAEVRRKNNQSSGAKESKA